MPILAAYAAFGVLWGVWQVLLVDLAVALALSEGPIGAALTIGFVGSLPAMVLAGRLCDRYGARRLSVATGLLLAAALAGFALVPGYPWFVAAVMLLLVASGSFDVAVNAVAMGIEQATRRQLLPILHAAFSAGGAAGALAAGFVVVSGADFRIGYLAVAGVVALTMLAWRATPEPADASVHEHLPLGGSVYRSPLLLVLAALTALAFFGEGAMETWSAIYLRSSLGGAALVGAAGVAVFHLAMLAGRLLTAAVSRRMGRVATVRAAGVLVALAMTLALATELPWLVIVGLLVVGLGLAAVAPIAFSLAGDAAPGRAGQASAVLTTIGYGGFLLGPAIIGGLAELASLRLALGVVVVTGAVTALLSGRLGADDSR